MMTKEKRTALAVFAVVLLCAVAVLQQPIDKLRPQFRQQELLNRKDKRETSLILDMSLQFFGAAAMGMREAVASMLWVQSDEFFHSGHYESILPLVRLVTWLDPHQIDVYSTGSWHLDYNFVDTEQRSDRRYIPPAIALMEEGVENNPEIYDLYFDLAWMHYYQKIRDYKKAVEWMEKATEHPSRDPNTGETMPRPAFVDRMLAHAYEKIGRYDLSEKQWLKSLAYSEMDAKRHHNDGSILMEVVVCKKNLGLLLLREAWRNGDMAAYDRGLKMLASISVGNMDLEQKRAYQAAKKSYEELKAAGKAPRDTQPPIDPRFQVTWKKVKPRFIIVQGRLNLVPAEYYKGLASEPYTKWYASNQTGPLTQRVKTRDGCRVRVILSDYDYNWWKMKPLDRFTWEVDRKQTVLMDEVMVRGDSFELPIDMSQDPQTYPFTKDKYKLTVWFSPQEAPDFIQDRIGWKGQGLLDRDYTDTSTIPGYKMLRKEFILKRSDIL